MNRKEIGQRLIEGAIKVIAKEGLDKASTKQIGLITSINEAYIYRCFEDKEDLLIKTFAFLDNELVNKAMQHVDVMYIKNIDYKTRCRVFFNAIWRFLLCNRNKCLAFVRYYYSPYFIEYSSDEHKKRYLPLVEKFEDAFRDEANVWMILNHILSTMLDFAVKVYNDIVPDNDDTEEHVFRLVYFSVRQYFKINDNQEVIA